jgi:hypothetical protein
MFLPPGFEVPIRDGHAVIPLPSFFGERDYRFLQARGCRFPSRHVALVPLYLPAKKPIQYGEYLGQFVATIQSRCQHLDVLGSCRLHGKIDLAGEPLKPEVCRKYPLPGTPLPKGCGFSFEEVEI